jgi:hypothetical protein
MSLKFTKYIVMLGWGLCIAAIVMTIKVGDYIAAAGWSVAIIYASMLIDMLKKE